MALDKHEVLLWYLQGKWPTHKIEILSDFSQKMKIISIDGARNICVTDEFLQTESWEVILSGIIDEIEKYFKLELVIGT